ncbi:MAG TPA: DUF6600 domain-containing protein [Kofleriaceae bacterium]
MRTLMICLVASSTLGACYQQQDAAEPQYSYGGYGDSQVVQGPPGGEMDPGYAYEDSNGYAGDSAPAESGAVEGAAPMDDQTVTGTVTDTEIDATLAPHGQWVVEAGYGRVWRPHTTVVGADFTPYETCGSWIYTDYGWTFTCDWDWGWLPFHYGQWAWFDNYWGWCPGYQWSPAWVEWRSNDRYVGWRPRAPIFRDHRGGSRGGVVIRDHRRPRDRDWRFLDRSHLGGRNIRQHTFHRADAVRDTVAGRPPIAAPRATPVRDVIRGRPHIRDHRNPRGPVTSRPAQPQRGPYNSPSGGYQPRPRGPYNTPQGGYQGEPSRPAGPGGPRPRGPSTTDTYQPPAGPGGPRPRGPGSDTYQPPRGPYNTPQGGYQPPRPRGPYNTPQGGYQGESSPRPSGGAVQPRPSGGYQPPARPSGGYQPPSRPSGGYQPPARPSGGYQPSRPSQPSRSYDPPARSNPSPRLSGSSYSPPSRSARGSSYAPPSRSSGSSHSSPSRSSGSSGGFGRRR